MTSVFSNMASFTDLTKSSPIQAQTSVSVNSQAPLPSVKVEVPVTSDTVEIAKNEPKEKKRLGPIKALKNTIANIKKFFATIGTYTKGFVKGVAKGTALGSVAYTAVSLFNKIKKKPDNTKLGIALGTVALVGSIAINLWNASLDLSEKKSDIDHRWTGHVK